MNYTAIATDQHMRNLLVDDLSDDEADNAMTALSALTSLFPSFFPFQRTFARPHYREASTEATGVRFVVYGEEGIERTVFLPRADLRTVSEAVDAATSTAATWIHE